MLQRSRGLRLCLAVCVLLRSCYGHAISQATPQQQHLSLVTAESLYSPNSIGVYDDHNEELPTTANFIFNSVISLMQRWPNAYWRNGHSIVPATIPMGTILYHGQNNSIFPTGPDWMAFDFEHAFLYCHGEALKCYVLTMMTTRELRLLYFDGSSGGKMPTGTMDSQDIVIWGKVMPEKWGNWAEGERIRSLCEWGKQYQIDGFVRLQMHFEVMMCDFTSGLETVSHLHLTPWHDEMRSRVEAKSPDKLDDNGVQSIDIPLEPTNDKPQGWRGSLTSTEAMFFEIVHAASWHDRPPGETRVHIDYTGFVSFYDASLTSLTDGRKNQSRLQHRLLDISAEDAETFREELGEVLARGWHSRGKEGSGIDWRSMTNVIVERYGERLLTLKYLLQEDHFQNVTTMALLYRSQLLIMLSPYMIQGAVPPDGVDPKSNTSWSRPIIEYCETSQTLRIKAELLTRQEKKILQATSVVLERICSTLGRLWVEAFDIEDAGGESQRSTLQRAREIVAALMTWLDWSMWVKCNPACGNEEMCYMPTWPYELFHDDANNMSPRCVRKLAPYTW